MVTEKRFIVEQTLLVTHQTVVYAINKKHALEKFNSDDVDPEQKPFYEAPKGAKVGTIKVYEGAEQ